MMDLETLASRNRIAAVFAAVAEHRPLLVDADDVQAFQVEPVRALGLLPQLDGEFTATNVRFWVVAAVDDEMYAMATSLASAIGGVQAAQAFEHVLKASDFVRQMKPGRGYGVVGRAGPTELVIAEFVRDASRLN